MFEKVIKLEARGEARRLAGWDVQMLENWLGYASGSPIVASEMARVAISFIRLPPASTVLWGRAEAYSRTDS